LESLRANGIRAEYIDGEDSQAERVRCLNLLQNQEIDTLVGSTIVDVGADVPAIGLIVLAGGGKSQEQLRQRIGRGLRAKKSGPNVAFVVDFADVQNNHLRAHYLARRGIVESTPGFGENIVEKDFDLKGLGFTKIAK
jgi:superfamily II DNA or RNA helicase